MSKFTDKKKEIMEAAKASTRKTFNELDFNELGTALLNEPEYSTKVSSTVKGEYTEKEIFPVKDLRKSLIGSIAKAAGCDASEQDKLVAEHQFPKLPLHAYMSEVIENYMDAGKTMVISPKKDLRATISIEPQKAEVKDVKSPKTGEVSKCNYAAYRKVKVKSNCPNNLRTKVK